MLKLVFNGRKLMELYGWWIHSADFGRKETPENGWELNRCYHITGKTVHAWMKSRKNAGTQKN